MINANNRLDWLVDRTQIWDLLIGYASSVDLREWDRWASYLDGNMEISLGAVGSVKGREACTTFAREALSDIGPTQHIITNPEITIEGNGAKVRAVLTTLHTVHENSSDYHSLQGFGFYHFDLVRREGSWLIARAAVEILHYVGDPGGRAAALGARRAS